MDVNIRRLSPNRELFRLTTAFFPMAEVDRGLKLQVLLQTFLQLDIRIERVLGEFKTSNDIGDDNNSIQSSITPHSELKRTHISPLCHGDEESVHSKSSQRSLQASKEYFRLTTPLFPISELDLGLKLQSLLHASLLLPARIEKVYRRSKSASKDSSDFDEQGGRTGESSVANMINISSPALMREKLLQPNSVVSKHANATALNEMKDKTGERSRKEKILRYVTENKKSPSGDAVSSLQNSKIAHLTSGISPIKSTANINESTLSTPFRESHDELARQTSSRLLHPQSSLESTKSPFITPASRKSSVNKEKVATHPVTPTYSEVPADKLSTNGVFPRVSSATYMVQRGVNQNGLFSPGSEETNGVSYQHSPRSLSAAQKTRIRESISGPSPSFEAPGCVGRCDARECSVCAILEKRVGAARQSIHTRQDMDVRTGGRDNCSTGASKIMKASEENPSKPEGKVAEGNHIPKTPPTVDQNRSDDSEQYCMDDDRPVYAPASGSGQCLDHSEVSMLAAVTTVSYATEDAHCVICCAPS